MIARSMLKDICTTMSGYSRPWWVAGGWAIDLYLGRQHRSHKDLDIAVLRRDQKELHSCFAAWSLHKVVVGMSKPWLAHETLELPLHQVNATRDNDCLEFLLNEDDSNAWRFRRNLSISMSLQCASRLSSEGIPYLCPEIVLLYKAKAPSADDIEDFERTYPVLDKQARQWLATALSICHSGHPWASKL